MTKYEDIVVDMPFDVIDSSYDYVIEKYPIHNGWTISMVLSLMVIEWFLNKENENESEESKSTT
jgi:hypothetical protein